MNTEIEAIRFEARKQFVALVDQYEDSVPLDQAAAWMCAEELGLESIDGMIAALDSLSDGLHIPEDSDCFGVVARINHRLFQEAGFHGALEQYDDSAHSMLEGVLASKTGLPIMLCLIYIEVARRVGIEVHGIGFPTHFLVSPVGSTPRFFVDPYGDGRVLRMDRIESWFKRILAKTDGRVPSLTWWLRPVTGRQLLLRMNNNLKSSYMRRNDLEGALRCVERILCLTPDALDVRRDRGLLRFELGLEEEGAADVDAYLAARKQPQGWLDG
jgi:regulator of sirC expression with transglutaminase-like and TPR domain